MQIRIEDITYTLPASLMEVTLQQRIEWEQAHGKELSEKLISIGEIPEGIHRDLALMDYHGDVATRTLHHFGGVPMDIVKDTKIEEVLFVYDQVMRTVVEDAAFPEDKLPVQLLEWKGEEWEIHPPELKHDSSMTFGEVLDAKQTVQNLSDLGAGRWEALLPLCCIYLRMKGERYSEALIVEGGARWEEMKALPMAHALEVAFFLTYTTQAYLKTFQSSGPAEAKEPVGS